MELSDRSEATRVVLSQFVATVFFSLLLLPFGSVLSLSAMLGGGVATLTNWTAACKIFVPYRAQLLAFFYGAEIRRILITPLLFAAILVAVPALQVAMLFGVYLVVQVAVPVLAVQFRLLDPVLRGQVK